MGPMETKIAIAVGARLLDRLFRPEEDNSSKMIEAIIAAKTEDQIREIVNEELTELVIMAVLPPEGEDKSADLIRDLAKADSEDAIKKAVEKPAVQKTIIDIISEIVLGAFRLIFGSK